MARKLAAYVHVVDSDARRSVAFGPDDDVPSWAAKQITNPKAWAGSDTETPEPTADATAGEPPPKAGRGSNREAWVAYAQASGVQVDDDASRDDVVAALDAAGVRTE